MSWGRGVFIGSSNQSETSRVAARVSLRMAPDACVAAPRAPHVWLHDQDVMPDDTTPSTCLIHSLVACKSTPQLTHVAQHASIADSAAPRASVCHSACCDHLGFNTSCFPCQLPCQAVDTTSYTCLKAWPAYMHFDTTSATCRSACLGRRLSGTSCFYVSLSML